jgi:sec-independent protein translocase protein TatB
MFDIGFWELLVIAVVLLLVMGPERLPEVAKQAAFFVRKARQGMYRLRSEMQGELDGTPFSDLEKAKQEMRDLKNDIRQFGRDLADSAEQKIGDDEQQSEKQNKNQEDTQSS